MDITPSQIAALTLYVEYCANPERLTWDGRTGWGDAMLNEAVRREAHVAAMEVIDTTIRGASTEAREAYLVALDAQQVAVSVELVSDASERLTGRS